MTQRLNFFRLSSLFGVSGACRIAASALVCMALTPSMASAGEPGFLEGTWILQNAYEIQPDGKLVHPYGMKPQGILMVDSDGRYMVEIYADPRPKFPSPQSTLKQCKAAFLGMSVHTGIAEVDEANHLLAFHESLSASSDCDMTVVQRQYVLEDDVLTYRASASVEGKLATPVSVWKRVVMERPRGDRPDPADRKAPDL